MGKYDAWRPFFRDLAPGEHRVPLEVLSEHIPGGLPPAAFQHQAWWSNSSYAASVWTEFGWYAHAKLRDGYVQFDKIPGRRGRPSRVRPETVDTEPTEPVREVQPGTAAGVIVVGCVSEKRDHPAPAKDLYTSPLWEKRRRYAESSGKPWYILSAEHGLLHPETTIAPYDVSLKDLSSDARREWARRTVPRLLETLVAAGVESVEFHAGSAYTESGIRQALEALGFRVTVPLAHLRIGEQLAWYGGQMDPSPPRASQTVAPQPVQTPTEDHVRRIADDYRAKLFGGGWEGLPEVIGEKAMRAAGADDVTVRRWITFVAAMDRARDADLLWEASVRAFQVVPWIYDPWQVIGRPHGDLQSALQKNSLSQRHKPDAKAWQTIAQSLTDPACPGPVIAAMHGRSVDAQELLEALQRKDLAGRPRFPLVKGPKIGPLWVRMLAFPGGVPIGGIEAIPVAVDTHVQRVTEMLGLIAVHFLDDRHRTAILDVWFQALQDVESYAGPSGIDGSAAGVDPALRALGREGCARCEQAGTKRAIGAICELCVLGRVTASPIGEPV